MPKKQIYSIYKWILSGFIGLFFASSLIYSQEFVIRMLVSSISFCILAIILYHCDKHATEKKNRVIAYILILLVFVTRFIYSWYAASRVEQISDFKLAIDMVWSGAFIDLASYYMMAPYKMVYPYILRFIGFSGNQFPLFIVQSFFASITALGIYLTAKEAAGLREGTVAIVLYLSWPGQIFYTSVFTEEHLAATVTIFITYLCVRVFNRVEEAEGIPEKGFILWIVLVSAGIGLLCGIDIMLKDWGVIIITAFIVMIPLFWRREKVLLILLSLIITISARAGIHQEMLDFVSDRIGGVTPDNGIYLHMYTSLDPDGTLSHNEDLTSEYMDLFISNGYDLNITHKKAVDVVKERAANNMKGFMKLLLLKIGRSYIGGNQEIIEWSFVEYEEAEKSRMIPFVQVFQQMDYFLYAGMVVMIVLAIINTRKSNMIFLALVIAGAMSSQLLIEAQGRYKYSIEPLWCVVAAIGIVSLRKYIKKLETTIIGNRVN